MYYFINMKKWVKNVFHPLEGVGTLFYKGLLEDTVHIENNNFGNKSFISQCSYRYVLKSIQLVLFYNIEYQFSVFLM